MAAYPCTDDPGEVLESVSGVEAAERNFENALAGVASSAAANADKFDKFVNGGVNEDVPLGTGQPTPTLRNLAHLVKSAGASLDGSDVSGKFSDASNGGTELRTLADRFGDVVNVKDFGAVCDGTTDDTEAVQDAVDAAAASGQTVWIPEGTLYARSDIDADGVMIVDDSRGIRVTTDDFWWRPHPTEQRWMAHRGYCSAYPENTVLAFTGAAAAGCYGIETDVQWTSDGYPVCMHDETIDRTTDGSGTVRSKTLAQVLALRADYRNGSAIGGGCFAECRVPRLSEFLDVCAAYGKVPFIEIKTGSSPSNAELEGILNLVRDYNMENSAFFTSFTISYLQTIRSMSKTCGLMYTVYDFNTDHLQQLAALGGKIDYAVNISYLNSQKIKLFRDEGIDVTAWNATNHLAAATAFSYGCTTFCGNAHYEGGALWR